MHHFFKTQPKTTVLTDGIVVMVENEEDEFCLFADQLLGEHQVVVKPLPSYIYKFIGEIKGISGCTIMGNGDMSLIVDVSGF
jgi:two-component system chemotaxis sensor kinase CheA